MSNKRGFTLIEVLITIVIISIVATIIGYVFTGLSNKQQATNTAQQFRSFVTLMQQRAIINNQSIQIRINPDTLQAYALEFNELPIASSKPILIAQISYNSSIHILPDLAINIGQTGEASCATIYFGTKINPKLVAITIP